MKNFLSVLMISAIIFSVPSCKSKVKDSDIKTAAEANLATIPSASGITVAVNEGIVTLSGEVPDGTARMDAETEVKKVKGVKSVVNNTSLAPPPPPVVSDPVIAPDDALTQSVKDAAKDHPGVTATVIDGVVTLTGSIKRTDLPTLMQKINAARPKKIENKLIIN